MIRYINSILVKRYTLFVILILCLSLRIALSIHRSDAEATRDAYNYIQIAQHIADGKGFVADKGFGSFLSGVLRPTAYGDPIYPYFLALMFSTAGDGLLGIYLVQAIIDTLTCLLVFSMALRFTSKRSAAVLAALLYAIYPPFIISTCTPMTETLSIFLIISSLYLLMIAFRKSPWHFALAGALAGLVILIKPAMLLFPFVVVMMLFMRRRKVGYWVQRAALYVIAAYLVMSPWTIRNYITMHAFIPVASHGGATLWGGTGPADGICIGSWDYPVDVLKPKISNKTCQDIKAFQEKLAGMSEVERDAALKNAAISEIKQHPDRYAFLAVKKLFRLWFNLWHDDTPSLGSIGIAVVNATLLLLGVLGYRYAKVDGYFKLTTLWVCCYTTIISVAVYAIVRYTYPVMPLIIILAAAYLDKWILNKHRAELSTENT